MTEDSSQARIYRGAPTARFTSYSDPKVEELVSNHIDRIVEAIVQQISPKAIVLAGSFGRGEGAVKSELGQLRVISDYEVAVVTWKAWKRNRIIRLSDQLSRELDAEVSLFWATPGRVNHNRMKNLAFGKSKPTRFMYDFKVGSVLLYGNLDLRKNRLSPEDISTWEGLRLIFNRLAEFLFQVEKVDFQRWVKGLDSGQSLPIPKSLLSAMNGLLVASGQFRPSSQERLRIFLEHKPFHINVDGMSEVLKNAVDSRVQGTTWQGIPWIVYRQFILDSLKILVKKTFDLQFEDIVSFPGVFHPSVKSQETVTQYEVGWLPIRPVFFERMIQKFKLKKDRLGREIHRFRSDELLPSLAVQSLIPGMVLLSDDGSFKTVLEGFRHSNLYLDDIITQHSDEWEQWDNVRQFLKPLWKTIC